MTTKIHSTLPRCKMQADARVNHTQPIRFCEGVWRCTHTQHWDIACIQTAVNPQVIAVCSMFSVHKIMPLPHFSLSPNPSYAQARRQKTNLCFQGAPRAKLLYCSARTSALHTIITFDFLLNILEDVMTLQRLGIIHGDLKLANCLITGPPTNLVATISDFGSAKHFHLGVHHAACNEGTAYAMALESLPRVNGTAGTCSADSEMHSIGIMIAESLGGNSQAVAMFLSHFPAFVLRMLSPVASDRPSATEVIGMVTGGKQLLQEAVAPGGILAPLAGNMPRLAVMKLQYPPGANGLLNCIRRYLAVRSDLTVSFRYVKEMDRLEYGFAYLAFDAVGFPRQLGPYLAGVAYFTLQKDLVQPRITTMLRRIQATAEIMAAVKVKLAYASRGMALQDYRDLRPKVFERMLCNVFAGSVS